MSYLIIHADGRETPLDDMHDVIDAMGPHLHYCAGTYKGKIVVMTYQQYSDDEINLKAVTMTGLNIRGDIAIPVAN